MSLFAKVPSMMSRAMVVALSIVAVASGAAHAQGLPSCSDTTMFPNPIFLTGTSTYETAAGSIAANLAAVAGAGKTTLVYSVAASCDALGNIRDGKALTGTADTFQPNADPTKPPVKTVCQLDGVAKADLAVSSVFYDSCPSGGALPAGLADVRGPVEAVEIVVPKSNTAFIGVSTPLAASIWGCAAGEPPFNSPMDVQQRDPTSDPQILLSKAIGVPAASFHGVMNTSSSGVSKNLANASRPNAAIGFMNADSYDLGRATLNALAFQAYGQARAFYADSSSFQYDRRPVRDGHYGLWGYFHFVATADASGTITNANAAQLIGWMTGTLATTAFDPTTVFAGADLVPQCAMRVQRDQDGGPLRPYTPAAPCGCSWESMATKVAAPASCVVCATGADCAVGKVCRSGFCE
jgi:hypothetical protein